LYGRFFACCVSDLDSYTAAFRLPDLIFKLLVTGALSASFIPVFSNYIHKKDKETAYKISSTVINLLLILFIIASVFVLIFTRELSGIITNNFTGHQLDLMVNLTRILMIAQIFFLISNFLTGILQVHQIFIIPALSPIIYNVFIILSIFTLTPVFGIYGAAIGAVVGAFFHLAIQIPVARRHGFKYSFSINPKLSGVKEIIRLMIPRSLSLGLGEIENTVTLFFASSLVPGSISLLNLALQLMYMPSRIFGTTVGQASLPMLSKNIARNELETFRKTVSRIILQSVYIALPVTILILINRVSIVRIAFGAKNFPWEATLLTAKTLAFLTPAIISQAVIQILIRSFYALHNTKTPLKVSIISLIINVILGYYFVNFTNMGIVGSAISASVGNMAQLFGLMYFFIKTVDGFSWNETLVRFNKIALSAAFMGAISWLGLIFLDRFIFDTSKTFNLIILFSINSFLGLVSYIVSSHLLHIEEYRDYERFLTKFSRFIFTK
jgi:putative peptidoglycan lipid II flippase